MNLLLNLLSGARVQRTTYESQGQIIPLDILLPRGAGPHGAVILLHGSDGAAAAQAYFRVIMQGLAGIGYAALFPHYFAVTGHGALGTPEQRALAVEHSFETWQQAVADAVTAAAHLPSIDSERLALAGVSLGSFLALGVAANNTRVRCVVEVCGGLPETVRGHVQTLPPVLILHGEDDPVVSVERAYELQREMDAHGLAYEMKIYPRQKHVFTREAELDALQRTRDFLSVHLSPKPS